MLLKKINLIYFFILMSSVLTVYSQGKSKDKQTKKLLKEAQYNLDNDNYEASWNLYRQILVIQPSNERASVNGVISGFRSNYPLDSLSLFVPSLLQNSLVDANYYLAKIYYLRFQFNEALKLLEAYNEVPEKARLHSDIETSYLVSCCITAHDLRSNPHLATIKNMGGTINSAYDDYVPVIMPDESALYFTSKREGSSNNKKNSRHDYFEDVYVSNHVNNSWTKAENIGPPINTETNDACVAINPSGTKMIVYRTAADQLSGDLYVCRMGANQKWEGLELMSHEINSPYIETSACFSNDTSEIFFSSDRPGGFGGKDLYRIKKLPNGNWSPPLNLGPTVNTAYDEDAPFLHPDGITLYFSSKGHKIMGEYDVFKCVWDLERNRFSEAENLGYPINDIGNDVFFVLSVDGQRGYYSSVKPDSYGGSDIYEIETRFEETDLKVEIGFITLDESPCEAKITLREKGSNEIAGLFFSNAKTGRFVVILNPFKTYLAEIESEISETQTVEIKPLELSAESHYLTIKLKKSNAQ